MDGFEYAVSVASCAFLFFALESTIIKLILLLFKLDSCTEEIVYSACIIAINIIPAIFIDFGKSLFFASAHKTCFVLLTILALINTVVLVIGILKKWDKKWGWDYLWDDWGFYTVIASGVVIIIAYTAMYLIAEEVKKNNIVEVGTRFYTEYYYICNTKDGEPNITYVPESENGNGYYVVVYESQNVDNRTKLDVIQIPLYSTEVEYAIEKNSQARLVVFTTEYIKEDRNQKPFGIISEKNNSYKLIVNREEPVN